MHQDDEEAKSGSAAAAAVDNSWKEGAHVPVPVLVQAQVIAATTDGMMVEGGEEQHTPSNF